MMLEGLFYSTSSQSLPGNVAPGSSGYASYVEETGTFPRPEHSPDLYHP